MRLAPLQRAVSGLMQSRARMRRAIIHRPMASSFSATRGLAGAANEGLRGLSTGELKRLLSERGVDYRDCIEKSDLMDKLNESSLLGICTRTQATLVTRFSVHLAPNPPRRAV